MSNDIRYIGSVDLIFYSTLKLSLGEALLVRLVENCTFFYDFQNHWGINDVMSFLHCWNRPLGCPLDMEYWLPPSRLPLEGMFSSLVELFVVCLENDDDDLSRISLPCSFSIRTLYCGVRDEISKEEFLSHM